MCNTSKNRQNKGLSSYKVSTKEKKIHDDMVQIFAEDFPSDATVKMWDAEWVAINCMVWDERHLTVQQISKFIGISSDLVHTVLTVILQMSKLFARWVPRKQMPEHKLKRVNISRTLLIHFQSSCKDFHCTLVNQDETWVQHFEPNSKIQSNQWKYSVFIPKVQVSSGPFARCWLPFFFNILKA